MDTISKGTSSRREFLKTTTRAAAASALATVVIPAVHAAGRTDTIQVAMVGCGGRGGGAAAQALSVKNGPIKLVALADVFADRITGTLGHLNKNFAAQIDVPAERQFLGLDAYRKAMDCLQAGDVVLLATPPAFRWVHFAYAIERGLNVFMEKPVTVDGPTSRRMLQLGEASAKKNLKVGVGLMCRHCAARAELYERIRGGAIGDIITMRAYRMHGPIGYFASEPKPEGISETMYQIQRFHSFLWASGGAYSDFYIHNIDECCWMKDAWPIRAQATGGRHYRGKSVDQNFDNYSVEYTYADGCTLFLHGRCMDETYYEFASYAHGTKGSAVISTNVHTPAKCRIYRGQDVTREDQQVWAFPQPEPDPYQLEWDHLIQAIREDLPFNEVERGVKASLVTSMGRMAAHTGQIITYEQMLNCEHEFAPGLDKLKADSPAPLRAGKNGKYPIPMPGRKKEREF